ncbi:MAG: hypothetical protein ACKO6N_01655 [Myxococcota bacterium]
MDQLLTYIPLAVGVLALLTTLTVLMDRPGRTARLAVVSGLMVFVELVVARALVYSPEQWSDPNNPLPLNLGIQLLSAWLLVMVATTYRWLWKRSRWPLSQALVGAVPVLVGALGLRALEAWQSNRLPVLYTGLPYDIALGVVGYLGPILTFEFLVHSELWRSRGLE